MYDKGICEVRDIPARQTGSATVVNLLVIEEKSWIEQTDLVENGFADESTDFRSNGLSFFPPSKNGTRKSSSSGCFAIHTP